MAVLQVPCFNPVVEDWTPECQDVEEYQKSHHCNVHLYVITKEMEGVFSIAEVVESAHTKGKTTIFHVIPDGFGKFEMRSLAAVVGMVRKAGGIAYVDSNLARTERVINNCFG